MGESFDFKVAISRTYGEWKPCYNDEGNISRHFHVLACFPFIPREEKGINVSPQTFKWLETCDPRKLQENL